MSNEPPPGLLEEYHKEYFHLRNNLRLWQYKLNRRSPGSEGHREAVDRVERWQQRLNNFLARTRPQSRSERNHQP